MSQAELVLALALAFATCGTAVFASSASMKTRRACVFRLLLYAVVAVTLAYAGSTNSLRFNLTASMPLGIYRTIPVPTSGVRRGMLVAACAPLTAVQLGRNRGYLFNGACPGGAEPVLKKVASVGGDHLAISASGITVNGCPLLQSRALPLDLSGRPLSRWPKADLRLRRDQIWLYANNTRSWDSRYWGPLSLHHIVAMVVPLFTVPYQFHSASGKPCGAGSR